MKPKDKPLRNKEFSHHKLSSRVIVNLFHDTCANDYANVNRYEKACCATTEQKASACYYPIVRQQKGWVEFLRCKRYVLFQWHSSSRSLSWKVRLAVMLMWLALSRRIHAAQTFITQNGGGRWRGGFDVLQCWQEEATPWQISETLCPHLKWQLSWRDSSCI